MNVHRFSVNDEKFLLDVNSGTVHQIDDIVFAVMAVFDGTNDAAVLSGCAAEFGTETVRGILQELHALIEKGQLFSPEQNMPPVFNAQPVVKSLCLHMAHDCNLRCEYCFAGTGAFGRSRGLMSKEVAEKAVDFLIDNGGGRTHAEIDFFGGEPLLNMDVVRDTVKYIRRREAETGKIFRLTLTTNAVLLADDTISFLNDENIALVLSVDGRREVHDRMRPFSDGSGSYDATMANVRRVVQSRQGKNYYVRGTFTANNLDFAADVLDLADLGITQLSVEPVVAKDAPYELKEEHLATLFEQYELLAAAYVRRRLSGQGFDFFHFNVDLKQGPCLAKRLSGCGAGHEYFAVTPTGELFPCHQFVGRDDYLMGTVFSGIQNKSMSGEFRSCHVLQKEECKLCWARFHCSGGCHANAVTFNGSIKIPYKLGCKLQKKRLECAIAVQSALITQR